MTPNPLPRKPRAFTLLELLIALALMVMVAGALYTSLFIGFKSRETGMRAIESSQRMSISLAMLSQDFDGALPPTGTLAAEFVGASPAGGSNSSSSGSSGSGGSGSPSGMGGGLSTSNSSLNNTSGGPHVDSPDPSAVLLLSFYTASNLPRDGELGGDIRKIELSLETPEGDPTPALIRRVYYNVLPNKQPTPRDEILCRNVRDFHLRYYDGTNWLDNWDSSAQNDTLPSAVEVSLELGLPAAAKGDPSSYKMVRYFSIPCGLTTGQAASSASGGN